LLVLICVPFIGHGEITVRDNWAAAGELSINGAAWSAVFRKDTPALTLTSDGQGVRIVPFTNTGSEPDEIVSYEVTGKDAPDQAEVRVMFSARGQHFESWFHFTGKGTVRITPGAAMAGLYVRSPIAVGILPGIRLEDVLYIPEKYPNLHEIHVPAENWFAGLLQGHDGIVVCAWPAGRQTVSLLPETKASNRVFGALKIALDGKEIFLEVLAGPGIWHNESLQAGYLEKTVEIDWKRPFPATYKTQIPLRAETTTPRTFLFQKKPNVQYRPEVGGCAWPVWFEGERPFLHLSKKIPPRGEAIMYPMENGEKTLMGFIHRTPVADIIVPQNERSALPHGPREAPNVGFVACGGTKVIRRTIFALGLQKREKEFLCEYADFLADYVAIVQKRNAAYFRFIDELRRQLDGWTKDPNGASEVRAYLGRMMDQADQTETGLRRKMEMYGENTPEQHIAHADRAAKRLRELLDTDDPEVYPECEELMDIFNRLAWAHAEVTGMRFSMLARQWAQQAAYGCVDVPGAVAYARAVRSAIRTALNGAPPW
jgi:hypothetical protein